MKVEYDKNAPAPLVSIIVPVWNGERYLKEMAQSIISQPVRNVEVIFIDDGSTDATAGMIQQISSDFRVELLLQTKELLKVCLGDGAQN